MSGIRAKMGKMPSDKLKGGRKDIIHTKIAEIKPLQKAWKKQDKQFEFWERNG